MTSQGTYRKQLPTPTAVFLEEIANAFFFAPPRVSRSYLRIYSEYTAIVSDPITSNGATFKTFINQFRFLHHKFRVLLKPTLLIIQYMLRVKNTATAP